jgi:hypothetical protein
LNKSFIERIFYDSTNFLKKFTRIANHQLIASSAGFGAILRVGAGFSYRESGGDSFNCLNELRNDRIVTRQGDRAMINQHLGDHATECRKSPWFWKL